VLFEVNQICPFEMAAKYCASSGSCPPEMPPRPDGPHPGGPDGEFDNTTLEAIKALGPDSWAPSFYWRLMSDAEGFLVKVYVKA